MFEHYLTHFAVILLPLLFVQIWVFRKSFIELPWRLALMGVYGALGAIWNQSFPVYILGIPAGFASVPIVISFLYGKRLAGTISMLLLIIWNLIPSAHPGSPFVAVAISIVLYSFLPFVLCQHFESYRHRTRWVLGVLISLATIVIQGLTYVLSILFTHPALFHQLGMVAHVVSVKLLPFLGIAFILQALMTIIPILLMDNIIDDGKLRMEMADNEHRYQSLVQFNPVALSIFDKENRFLMANTAYQKMTGYDLSELAGRSRFDLWFAEDMAYAHMLGRTAQTGEVFIDVAGRLRHKNGSPIDVRFTNVPMMAGKTITGYFSLVTDVTENLRIEKHLRDTEKLSIVGQLAASIAHEIRNPLTALFGFLKLLEEQAATETRDSREIPNDSESNGNCKQGTRGSTSALLSYIEIMRAELNRMHQISGQLLMLGKPQTDYFEPQDAKAIIRDVVTLLEPQTNMSNIEVTIDLAAETMDIWCDKNQIKQAIINIVKNAIEATTSSNGKITLQARRITEIHQLFGVSTGRTDMVAEVQQVATSDEGTTLHPPEQIEIIITDNGPGMPETLIARLGEPFYTTKAEGTGLGLLVTKRIVQAHGGHIEFHSQPGQGTTVRLVFDAYVGPVVHLQVMASKPAFHPEPQSPVSAHSHEVPS